MLFFHDLKLGWCKEHPSIFFAPVTGDPGAFRMFMRSAPGGDDMALAVYDRLCRHLKPKKFQFDADKVARYRQLLFPDGFPFSTDPAPSLALVQGSLLGAESVFRRRRGRAKKPAPLADWRAEVEADLEAKYEGEWEKARAEREAARASSAASASDEAPELKPAHPPIPALDGLSFRDFLECGLDFGEYKGKEKLNKINDLEHVFPPDAFIRALAASDLGPRGHGLSRRVRGRAAERPLANVMRISTTPEKEPCDSARGLAGLDSVGSCSGAYGPRFSADVQAFRGRDLCRWGRRRAGYRVDEAHVTVVVYKKLDEFRKAKIAFRYKIAGFIKQGLKYNGLAYRRINDDLIVENEGFNSFMACATVPIPEFSHDGRWVNTKKGKKPKWKEKTRHWATTCPGLIQLYDDFDKDGNYKCSHLSGLVRCKNGMFCPICGAQVRAIKRNVIKQISKYEADLGKVPLLATFKTPHGKDNDPFAAREFISRCMKKLKNGGWYTRFLKKWGCKDWVYTLECTVDDPRASRETGAHWHYHCIFWLDREGNDMSETEKQLFMKELKRKWCDIITKEKDFCEVCNVKDVKRKRASIIENGVHVDYITNGKALKKGETKDAVDEYVGDALAFELSPDMFTKEGHANGRMSAFEYIAYAAYVLAVHQDNSLFPYAIRLMEAMKGQHCIQPARGLMNRAGVSVESAVPEPKEGEKSLFVGCFWAGEKDKANMALLPDFFHIARFHAHRRFIDAYEEKRRAGVGPQEAFRAVYEAFEKGYDPMTGEDLYAATYGPGGGAVPVYGGGKKKKKGARKSKSDYCRERFQEAA